MKSSQNCKLVVFVPLTHADDVRRVIGEAGAGVIGNYSFCTFSSRGVGRFIGGLNSNPAVGKSGILESVEEERIETVCPINILSRVIDAIKSVHPYKEVALDVYPLQEIK